MQKYKIAFLGTPDFTTYFLDLFLSNQCNDFLKLTTIITGEDKPGGRGMQIKSPAPKKWLEQLQKKVTDSTNLPKILQPKKLDNDLYELLKKENFDLFIVIAYGKIIPEKFINLPRFGTINLHYSLLPKYRGASPVETAILNNDTETGITIQQMQFELDSGNILFQEKIPILETETTTELRHKLNKRALEIFPEFLKNFFINSSNLSSNKEIGIKQDSNKITFCKKIKKEELNVTDILFNNNLEKQEKLKQIYLKWRAYDKKIFFFIEKQANLPLRIKITEMEINTETKEIKITKLLPESKKEITIKDFENSYQKLF